MTPEGRGKDVFRLPGFFAWWTAETVSEFGAYFTTVALQVLVVLTLGGTAAEVGLVSAARWLPYAVLGLLVGALMERGRRRPVLIGTDLARGLLLGLIPLLWLLDRLELPILVAFVAGFGALSLLNDSASQSFLPRLVPQHTLLAANARLDQSASVAQASGPALAGGLVALLGAPLAVLVNSMTYLYSALVVGLMKTPEPAPPATAGSQGLWADIGEGLRFTYRHRMLGPLTLSTHGWFLANSVLVTVFVPYALLGLGLSPFEFGAVLACAGVGALIGASFSSRWGLSWGAGRVVIACRASMAVSWAIIAMASFMDAPGQAISVVAVGQLLCGLAMGAENANEMGYRQAVTPDRLQARMNTTTRSMNRAMIVIAAPLGGLAADAWGYAPIIWVAAACFVLVAAGLAASDFRHARHGDLPEDLPQLAG